jgi:hypothetical protein
VTAAWLAASGLPYTPFTGVQQVWFASGALAYQTTFGDENSQRLPPFHQLDLSTQIAKQFGRATATVGGTVFNVYDRQNVVAYDYETVGSQAAQGQTLLMRRAVNVFFRVGF